MSENRNMRGMTDSDDILTIGDDRQLFIDNSMIRRMKGVSLRMHEPVPREKVFTFDQPWEGKTSWSPVVLRDGDLFRMWYRAARPDRRYHTCYAESTDGVHWERPSLGLFEFQGSKENNIVITDIDVLHVGVFRDDGSDVPEAERYKAVGGGHVRKKRPEQKEGTARKLFGLASPDGIHWSRVKGGEALVVGPEEDPSFDSPVDAFWDPRYGLYRIYVRGRRPSGKKGKGDTRRRAIRTTTSKDFLNWEPLEYIDIDEDPWKEHLYTNSCHLYYRAPYYLMFPKRFEPVRKFCPEWEYEGQSDVVFMAGRDGRRFFRLFRDAFLRPGLDPRNWHERAIGISSHAVKTGAGEMSLYSLQNYRTDSIHLRRFSLREDGFVSLSAPWESGEATTRPLEVKGSALEINYSTSAVGYVKLELQDQGGQPLPGHSLADCEEIFGDEISRVVKWGRSPDVRGLENRPVRIKFAMKDADLYSFRFF